jgi:hypothetical protein
MAPLTPKHSVMVIIGVVLILCLFILGCAYRVTLRSDSPSEDFAKANRAFRSLRCQVQLADTMLKGQSEVRLRSDTIRWNDPDMGERRQVPFQDVYSIKAANHKKGIIPGALVGLLLGYGVGAAVGASHVKGTDSGGFMDFGDIGGGIALGFGVGVPIFLGGVLIGYSIGVPVEAQIETFSDSTSGFSQ